MVEHVQKLHQFRQRDEDAAADGVTLEHFHAYMPQHSYIFAPTREMWPTASVNARIPPVLDYRERQGEEHRGIGVARPQSSGRADDLGPRQANDHRRPLGVRWRLDRAPRGACLQSLSPADNPARRSEPGQPLAQSREQIFPNDFDHIIAWLAHRVQHPEDKINHALVLGGSQGIGKDTILEPVKHAIGPWNFHEVSPQHMLGRFNGFREIGDPARQRGARSRRRQPLCVLRPHEGLHGRTARRAAL